MLTKILILICFYYSSTTGSLLQGKHVLVICYTAKIKKHDLPSTTVTCRLYGHPGHFHEDQKFLAFQLEDGNEELKNGDAENLD